MGTPGDERQGRRWEQRHGQEEDGGKWEQWEGLPEGRMNSGNDSNRGGSGRGTHQTGPNDVYRMERLGRSSYMPLRCTVVVTKIMYLTLNTD
jgi:hypothetical protein